jgi:integrase
VEWDTEIRPHLSEDDLWFAPVDTENFEFVEGHTAGKHRQSRARKDLKEWVDRIGLPYYSPHKFRHGHATYGLSNAVTVPDLKAVSQNLMHSNLSITDGIYAILSENELGERISRLGLVESTTIKSNGEIIEQLERIILSLRQK